MAIEFHCKECDQIIVVQYLKPGEKAMCRNCGAENIVPADATETDKKPEYNKMPPVFDETPPEKSPTKKQSDIVEVYVLSKSLKPFPGFLQTLLLFFFYFTGGIILVVSIVIIGKIIGQPIHKDPIILFFVASAAWVVVLYFGYTKVNETFKTVFSLKAFKWLPIILICLVLLGLRGCIDGIGSIAVKLNPQIMEIEKILLEDLVEIFSSGIGWSFFRIVIIAPVIEEMFFRGLLLRGYLKRYSTPAAILVTALLFGLMHVQYLMIIWGFIFGLLLAWLYLLTRSLWPCIIVHSFSNLTALIVFYGLYNPAISNGASMDKDVLAELILIAIGAIMCTVGIGILIKTPLKKELDSPVPLIKSEDRLIGE